MINDNNILLNSYFFFYQFYTSELDEEYKNDENKNFPLSKSTFLEQISQQRPVRFYRKQRNAMSSPSTSESSSAMEIQQLLLRMRLWESALQNHFQGQNPENLASNPLWAKLLKVCYIGIILVSKQ